MKNYDIIFDQLITHNGNTFYFDYETPPSKLLLIALLRGFQVQSFNPHFVCGKGVAVGSGVPSVFDNRYLRGASAGKGSGGNMYDELPDDDCTWGEGDGDGDGYGFIETYHERLYYIG